MSRLIINDRERVADWVAGQVGQRVPWEGFNAFGVELNDEIVAGVVIHQINGANAFCHIAIDKPVKRIYEMFMVVCDYSFRQLGLKRLTGLVPANEEHIVKFDMRLGFEIEFIMKDAAVGADLVGLVMWADKCPWLPKGN